jgi:phenylalanyl-tRNA synthetase alpha subunit
LRLQKFNIFLSSGWGVFDHWLPWKAAANQAGDQIRIKEEALASAQARVIELQSAGKAHEGKEKEKAKELKEKLKELKDADKRSKREMSELQESVRVAQERINQLEATIKVAAKATAQQQQREGALNELQQRHEALLRKL